MRILTKSWYQSLGQLISTRPYFAYLFAIIAPLLTLLIHHLTQDYFNSRVYFLFYPTVFVTGLLFGFLPGVVSTLHSSLLIAFFLLQPEQSFFLTNKFEFIPLLAFFIMGMAMSLVSAMARFYRKKELRHLEQEIHARTEELSNSRGFLDSLIENLPNMVFVKEAQELKFVRFNKAGCELLGISSEELLGKNDYDFFPKEQADAFTQKDREVLKNQTVVDIPEEPIETRYQGGRILHTKKIPILGPDGKAKYLLGISEDITEQIKAQKERMQMICEEALLEEREKAAKRNTFLAEASTLLSSTLDYHQTLRHLAKLAVSVLGDWATVIMVKNDGHLHRLAAVHTDPQKNRYLEMISDIYEADGEQSEGAARVIASGKSLFMPVIEKETLAQTAKDPTQLEAMEYLGCFSCMIVPICAHHKVHGAISLVSANPHYHFSTTDLDLAEELGRRAGAAIDNSLLYEAAQNAIKVRDNFMSMASHELKTPITSLKMQFQMAKRKMGPDHSILPSAQKWGKILNLACLQVDRLTNLVEDMLDISRIQEGKLSFNVGQVNLTKLVEEVCEGLADQLRESKNHLEVAISPRVIGLWDKTRLEQVLINLIANAIKYAPGTLIKIEGLLLEDNAVIIVSDRGPGIAREKLERIFERYERATPSRSIAGLGLGLYISRQIVLAHSGEIWAESASGEGAKFMVKLPLNPLREVWQEEEEMEHEQKYSTC